MRDRLAPVVIFVYNRPIHTRRTLEALAKNELSDQTRIIIFADGAKTGASPQTMSAILETRKIIREYQGFKFSEINEFESNRGLAKSIIEGVSSVINKYGKVIVLEDDIVTGPHFLEYMNEALRRYDDVDKVWHISGWTYPVRTSRYDKAFFWKTMNCWGWATWANRWQYYRKDVDYLLNVFSERDIWKFNVDGTENFWQQVIDNKNGIIDTWAIFWYATIFSNNGLCLSPYRSLVNNIGLDGSGVHCGESPADTITGAIDHVVVDFPSFPRVNRWQFIRLKAYFRKKNRQMLTSMTSRLIDFGKAILRLIGLFEVAKKIHQRSKQSDSD